MSTSRRRDLPGSQQELRANTAERLEAIVAAAEQAAQSVIDDAEAQARRYLAQARAEADRLAEGRLGDLSELIDSLLGQAAALRREAERLQASLEAAKEELADEAVAEVRSEPSTPPQPEPPQIVPEPPRLRAVSHGEDPAQAFGERRSDAAGARLLATQMAVSGSSREEIDRRLRNGFEIEDTTAILDAILGPEE
jgi:hypothetical protein